MGAHVGCQRILFSRRLRWALGLLLKEFCVILPPPTICIKLCNTNLRK